MFGAGTVVNGMSRMAQTNLEAAKESPEVQEAYMKMNKEMNKEMRKTIIVGGLVLLVAITGCSILKYHMARKDDAELEITRASCRPRKQEPENNDDADGDSDSSSEAPKLLKAADIVGETNNMNDGQLLGQLLFKGDSVIIFGSPGSGKSTLVLQLVIDIAVGRKSRLITDEYDQGNHNPSRVIYYDGEMDDNDFRNFMGEYDCTQLNNIEFYRNFYFEKAIDWVRDLRNKLDNCTSDTVVVLDNASCVGLNNSPEAIRKLFLHHFKNLREKSLLRGFTITFIVISHTNKEQKILGSSNLHNFSATLLRMQRNVNDNTSVLTVEKNRKYGEMQGKEFKLKFTNIDGHKGFENVGDIGRQKPSGNTDTSEIMFGKYTLSQAREVYELSKKTKRVGNEEKPYSRRDIAKHASFDISHTRVGGLIKQYEAYLAKSRADDDDTEDDAPYEEVE